MSELPTHLSVILLQLVGAVMLLLYATRMVRTGFERAAGSAFRSLLLRSSGSMVGSVCTGVIIALLLQSSTAVALLVSGFAGSGSLTLAGATGILLGADVGTAVVVQLLSFPLDGLIPALLAVGGFSFLKINSRGARQAGRVIMGIGLILVSLHMIGEATEPLREGSSLSALVSYLGDDTYLAFAGGLVIAFAFHSSVAAILLFAALAAQSVLTLDAALPMVLGANAGGAFVALWLTREQSRKTRRITLSNVMFRVLLAMIAVELVRRVDLAIYLPGASADRQLVNFHLFFNMALVLICLPLVKPALALSRWLLGRDPHEQDVANDTGCALDRNVLDKPDDALASVTRELLRLSQRVESMVAPLPELFLRSLPDEIDRIRALDVRVDKEHTDIKMYIAELTCGTLTAEQARRGIDLTGVAINLERVGDIVAKDLLLRVEEMHARRRQFSADGWQEISTVHAHVIANMQLALNVLISEDLESAKHLVEEKTRLGKLERETRNRHLRRLVEGTPESIATSDQHMEVVRALREINSLYTAVAYPILARYGVLLDSRIAASAL